MHSFFEDYKKLEKKTVVVEGFDGPEQAKKTILEGIEAYKKYVQEQESKASEDLMSPKFQQYKKFYG